MGLPLLRGVKYHFRMKARFTTRFLFIALSWLALQDVGRCGVLDFLGLGDKSTNSTALPAAVTALSQDQVVQGLKQALSKGVQQAVNLLGHDGGFLTNLN